LGWVQTETGKESTDANELKKGGALMPLGGHKGYGLGAAVDILSAVLSGANYGPWVPPFVAFLNPLENLPGNGIGHFLGAMRIDAFRPADDFKMHMDNWIDRFRKTTPIDAAQPVLIPGDPEREMEAIRMTNGIPIVPSVVNDLQEVGNRFGISLK
jgi:LDH2 family malate/lactate/ureidoglycolate dehydrogenase